MDFRKIRNLKTFIKRPGKKWLVKFGIGGAIAVVLLAGLLVAGYAQAKQAAAKLDETTTQSAERVRQQLADTTKTVNRAKTTDAEALKALQQLANTAKAQASICAGIQRPAAPFLHRQYQAARQNCQQQQQAAQQLQVAVGQFIPKASFMTKLHTAVKPGLNAADAGSVADPGKVASAWQQSQSKLAGIGNVPDGAKSAYGAIAKAAKNAAAHAKTIQKAQTARDTQAFTTAKDDLAKAYDQLRQAGGELRGWLVGQQKKLLTAAQNTNE